LHSHHDKTRGWQPFWAALGAALLVLLPLVGGTILLTRQSLRTRLAAKPQSGVAVRMPKTENQLTLLVCTAGEQPGFVLLYLNASQNCIRLAALPAETAIPFGQGEATLAQCYAAAGPARCREALLEPLALPETTRYLALSPSVLAAIADRYGMLRVGFSGALTADELAQCSLSGGVQALSAREAQSLFSGWDKDGTLPPSHRAAARAAVWDAFFRQDLELLPTTLPAALRAHSSELLTDLTAQDFFGSRELGRADHRHAGADGAAFVQGDVSQGGAQDGGMIHGHGREAGQVAGQGRGGVMGAAQPGLHDGQLHALTGKGQYGQHGQE